MGKKIWVIFYSIIGLVVSGVVYMTQVSYQEATSNLLSWPIAKIIIPKWAQGKNLDTVVAIFGILVVLASMGAIIYIIKKDKKKSTETNNEKKTNKLPLKLNIASCGSGLDEIRLQSVVITNQSKTTMNLSFELVLRFNSQKGLHVIALEGWWKELREYGSKGKSIIPLDKESSLKGMLIFNIPSSTITICGLTKENLDLKNGAVLEIYERIKNIRVACHPLRGYPPEIKFFPRARLGG